MKKRLLKVCRLTFSILGRYSFISCPLDLLNFFGLYNPSSWYIHNSVYKSRIHEIKFSRRGLSVFNFHALYVSSQVLQKTGIVISSCLFIEVFKRSLLAHKWAFFKELNDEWSTQWESVYLQAKYQNLSCSTQFTRILVVEST